MEIQYFGHASFRLKGKYGTVIADPYDPEMVGFKYPSVEADIVTISHDHGDHNYLNGVKEYVSVITGPGEYEIKEISILGFPAYHDDKKGEERGKNTIYVYEIDGLRLLHLGDMGHKLGEKMVEEIGEIDILMIPVGGFYTIDAQMALSVIDAVEPAIIIPMHYKMPGMNDKVFANVAGVDDFLKAASLPVENLPKLTIKKNEIGDIRKVIVLDAKNKNQ